MTNKYLEKIAKQMSDEEIHRHGTRQFWKGIGGGMLGGAVIPVAGGTIGAIAGNAHELAAVKSKITGKKVGMKEVAGDGGINWLRSAGRGMVEGIGGAGAGAGIGAGIGHLVHRNGGAQIGGVIGGISGLIAGSAHGQWRSAHNSMRDDIKRWESDAKAGD